MSSEEITEIRVGLAGKASMEFVLTACFLALVAQFIGFLVIANITVQPVKDDVAEIKQDLKGLAISTAQLGSSADNITVSLASLSEASAKLTGLDSDILRTGKIIDNFTQVWLSQPLEVKSDPAALRANFEFYFDNISDLEQRRILEVLEGKLTD